MSISSPNLANYKKIFLDKLQVNIYNDTMKYITYITGVYYCVIYIIMPYTWVGKSRFAVVCMEIIQVK